jgi:hypothetical protein
MQDPQSLHKYLYVHGDPVNGIDPTGEFLAGLGITVCTVAFRMSKELGYSALATTAAFAAVGSIGGAITYEAMGESPWVGAYNGALIGGGFRIAYLAKGKKGLFNAFLDGSVAGVSRTITELVYAYRPGSSDGRTDAEILRAAALKGADSFASGVWSSATSLLPKPAWLEWANSPLGKGFVGAIDAAITSVWGDINKIPMPDNATIAENAATAAAISAGSTVFKTALLSQFPDIPDTQGDDIVRAVMNTVINVVVGFDAKGIAEFIKFWGEF